MMESKTEHITLVVTPATRKQLETIARQEDVSIAHVIRQAIKWHVHMYQPKETPR